MIYADIPLGEFAQLCDEAASVDDNGHWVRAWSRGHSQLAELQRIGSVAKALSTRWDVVTRQLSWASGLCSCRACEEEQEERDALFHGLLNLLQNAVSLDTPQRIMFTRPQYQRAM
jgi:hypothetical protein